MVDLEALPIEVIERISHLMHFDIDSVLWSSVDFNYLILKTGMVQRPSEENRQWKPVLSLDPTDSLIVVELAGGLEFDLFEDGQKEANLS